MRDIMYLQYTNNKDFGPSVYNFNPFGNDETYVYGPVHSPYYKTFILRLYYEKH